MKATYEQIDSRMKKSLDALLTELNTVRAGRANVAVLDRIRVDYYGVATKIDQMAAVSVPEPRTLMITPWDGGTLKTVEKAILESDIGINPQNDGKAIRLNFPPLTEERRKDLTKQVHKFGEDAKVAIRNIRRDEIEHYKTMKKNSEITEDDLKDIESDIQEMTDKYVKDIDTQVSKKEKELLEV